MTWKVKTRTHLGWILSNSRPWVLGVFILCSTTTERWLHVNPFRTKLPHNKDKSRLLIQYITPYSIFQYQYLMRFPLNTWCYKRKVKYVISGHNFHLKDFFIFSMLTEIYLEVLLGVHITWKTLRQSWIKKFNLIWVIPTVFTAN